jgi:hypothetical protein
MSEAVGRELMESRLRDNYTGDWDIFYPNTIEDAPSPTYRKKAYIKVSVSVGVNAAFQVDSGGGQGGSALFRVPGLFIMSINWPLGEGLGDALTEADDLETIFRGGRDASGSTKVVYRSPNTREVGPVGQFYQLDVEIPFEIDTNYSV